MKLLVTILLGLVLAPTAGAKIQLPRNGLCYAQCNDNDPARSLRLDWKLTFRGNQEKFTTHFKLVNPSPYLLRMGNGFGSFSVENGEDNDFSGNYSFDDGSKKGILLSASAELPNKKKVRISTRLPYTTSPFHIRKRDLVIEGTLKNKRSSRD